VAGRSRPVPGSFKNAKKLSGGGDVPTSYYARGGPVSERQARLNRIKAFEMQHANRPV
jgi:hypothetical protein